MNPGAVARIEEHARARRCTPGTLLLNGSEQRLATSAVGERRDALPAIVVSSTRTRATARRNVEAHGAWWPLTGERVRRVAQRERDRLAARPRRGTRPRCSAHAACARRVRVVAVRSAARCPARRQQPEPHAERVVAARRNPWLVRTGVKRGLSLVTLPRRRRGAGSLSVNVENSPVYDVDIAHVEQRRQRVVLRREPCTIEKTALLTSLGFELATFCTSAVAVGSFGTVQAYVPAYPSTPATVTTDRPRCGGTRSARARRSRHVQGDRVHLAHVPRRHPPFGAVTTNAAPADQRVRVRGAQLRRRRRDCASSVPRSRASEAFERRAGRTSRRRPSWYASAAELHTDEHDVSDRRPRRRTTAVRCAVEVGHGGGDAEVGDERTPEADHVVATVRRCCAGGRSSCRESLGRSRAGAACGTPPSFDCPQLADAALPVMRRPRARVVVGVGHDDDVARAAEPLVTPVLRVAPPSTERMSGQVAAEQRVGLVGMTLERNAVLAERASASASSSRRRQVERQIWRVPPFVTIAATICQRCPSARS